MSGYLVPDITADELLELAKEEYDDVIWDSNSLIEEDDCLAVFGWDDDGEYIAAIAYYYERSDEEAEEMIDLDEQLNKATLDVINDRELSFEEQEIIKHGWSIKFIYECEGPVIKPNHSFLMNRPPAPELPKEKVELPEWIKEHMLKPGELF
jgi:hypothetical protein